MPMGDVWPWGVINSVVAPSYKFEIMLTKSSGSLRITSVLTSWPWSADGNASLKYK